MAGEKQESTVSRGTKRVKVYLPHSLRKCSLFCSAFRHRLFLLCSLIAFVTVVLLTYPSIQSDGVLPISSFVWSKGTNTPPRPLQSLNSALLMYSSIDAYEPVERETVKQLLERSIDGGQKHRNHWRENAFDRIHHFDHYDRMDYRHNWHGRSRKRMSPDLTNPKYAPYWSQFRQMLESWVRKKHYDPLVMKDLITLVKNPIDRHYNIGEADSQLVKPYRTCAVIGNSGILLQKTYGEFIDEHDMVMRLNNAKILGYEAAVGRKTTLSFINSNVLHHCSRHYRCRCNSYGESVPTMSYICQVSHLMDLLYCRGMYKAPLLMTDPRLDVLCSRIAKYYSLKNFFETVGGTLDEWSSTHEGDLFHYSSGMQAVVLALGICDRVNLFGFGKSPSAKHHYHTNQKAELGLHDYAAEYIFYNDLVHNRSSAIPFLSQAGIVVPPVKMFM